MPQASVNGTQLSYLDTGGDGMPVLLIHAFPLSSKMWDSQIEALGSRFRLIAPDLKGFGSSDAPEDRSSYSMDSYAEDLNGLLDHLGLARVAVVGISLGGYIAFALMRSYRSKVAALVLADTRAEADPPEGIEKRTGQQNMVSESGTAGLREALPGALLGATTKDAKPDVVARARSLMDNPPAGFIGALEAMKNRPDSSSDLASVDVPVLVIVGEEDAVTPPEASRKLHEGIAGSRLVVIPGAGHLSNLESPDAFNGAVAEFLGQI